MLSHRTSVQSSAWRLASLPVALAALLALAAPAAASNPPGNNGTIKVDRVVFDDHPNNQPHVGCDFQVDFYGYDAGAIDADVIFELHPPTAADQTMSVSGDTTPSIGEDDNAGGGSVAGLDASVPYTLSFTGDPHPQQGYHVKLTIHAPGSQGADVKHKVFWVTGCEGQLGGNPPSNPPVVNGQGQPPPQGQGTLGGSSAPVSRVPDTSADPGAGLGAWAALTVLLVGAAGGLSVALGSRRSKR